MTELGTLTTGDVAVSVAIAINDLGQVTGYAQTDAGTTHAFLWSTTTGMQDLGALGTGGADHSEAWAVNNAGVVVGKTGTPTGVHAFVWTPERGMVDLNTLVPPGTGLLDLAQGINDSGEIAATTTGLRALLLTPVGP